MEITFEGVSKQYKSKHALKNFTAALNEGVYGLLGENGAGRSCWQPTSFQMLSASRGKSCC